MKIITICGSTKFKNELLELGRELTLQGNIVLMPLVFSKSGDIITKEQERSLIELHARKIELAEEVHFLYVDDYNSPNVANELKYACELNKPIITHIRYSESSITI